MTKLLNCTVDIFQLIIHPKLFLQIMLKFQKWLIIQKKMKKIITAINNPNLNEKLKQENNLEIICKDIQYKEAILEILLENKNVGSDTKTLLSLSISNALLSISC